MKLILISYQKGLCTLSQFIATERIGIGGGSMRQSALISGVNVARCLDEWLLSSNGFYGLDFVVSVYRLTIIRNL